MSNRILSSRYQLRIIETPEEMVQVEDIQRSVWSGNETDIVPMHLLLTVAHNGGIIIGAFDMGSDQNPKELPVDDDLEAPNLRTIPPGTPLVGFVFGFPGLYSTPDGPRIKHCSHQMGVHPEHRDKGIGFALKRAQWQMVRHQGLDRITWTYDPLQSRNAYLNISRLGTVCNTYHRDTYGEMRDDLNVGLPSDRFQVDWWINSQRVRLRLSKKARRKLDLAHYLSAGSIIINPTKIDRDEFPMPNEINLKDLEVRLNGGEKPLLLVEIPSDFQSLKEANPDLAVKWRFHTRSIFENLFGRGYLTTDFVYMPGSFPRSFYILVHGESTL